MKTVKMFIAGLLIGSLAVANINTHFINAEKDPDSKLLDIVETLKSDYHEDFDETLFYEYMYESGTTFFSDPKTFNDPYTVYFPSDDYADYKQSLSDKYVGMGIAIKDLIVQGVYTDSPADRAGVLKGDILMAINEESVIDDNDFVSKVQAFGMSESFNVTANRNGTEVVFEIIKESIKIENVHSEPEDKTIEIPEDIGYVSMDRFSQSSYTDLKTQLEGAYADKQGIILDLRNNPGGYLNEASKIAMYLLSEGDIIYYEESKGEIKETKAVGEGYDKPIVILINGYSASASELLAAALKENGKATLVGETSYGKGVMQSTVQFEDGSGLKYTSAKWLTPNKLSINETGVTPDYTEHDYEKQIELAISTLKDMISK